MEKGNGREQDERRRDVYIRQPRASFREKCGIQIIPVESDPLSRLYRRRECVSKRAREFRE